MRPSRGVDFKRELALNKLTFSGIHCRHTSKMAKKVICDRERLNDSEYQRLSARHRLYCHETLTLSDLNDNTPNGNTMNLSSRYQNEPLNINHGYPPHTFDLNHSKGPQKIDIDQKNQSKCKLPCVTKDPNKSNIEFINEEKRDNNPVNRSTYPTSLHQTNEQNQQDGKFIKGLLNEFTNPLRSDPTTEKPKKLQTFPLTLTSLSESPSRRDEQEVPDVTLKDEDTSFVDEEDILVIHDEIMTSSWIDSDSGSDIDWSSLTPPAPRSPSDQRVPEYQEEMRKSGDLGCDLNHANQRPEMSLFDSPFGYNLFDQPFNVINFQTQTVSMSDHVVPQSSGNF